MLTSCGLIVVGLVVLVLGAELLVRGASRLAFVAGVSPLVIGLTVVAFGTSTPELAVSVQSSFAGQTDIAVGNVVGSNIFNVLFILGVSALVAPLTVSSQLIRLDVPVMIAVSFLALILGWDGAIGRLDGSLLFAMVVGYTGWTIKQSRKETAAIQQEFSQEYASSPTLSLGALLLQLLFIIGGLALLGLGAKLLVDGAVNMARLLGMSELLIGLTIVAGGTSLPEVAASVMATIRGERDIAVGNVVGSNIFNILCVLGLSGVVSPGGIEVSDAALRLDIPVMIAVAVACLPIFFTGNVISRWEGALFLGYYAAYTTYLVLSASKIPLGETLGMAMLTFVLPLTAITLLIGVARNWRTPAVGR